MKKGEIIIDAARKKLGRLASEVAVSLRGKTMPDFLPYDTSLPKVTVKNADSMNLDEKKLKESSFARYSGYPSGRKVKTALEIAQKDKCELLRMTVLGMLPKNRLKKEMIKNLIIYHGEDR